MLRTYRGVLSGNQIRWTDDGPPAGPGHLEVHVTVVGTSQSPEDSGSRIAMLLDELAKLNPFKDISDPVEWQRELRKDRPLPGGA